MKSIITQEAVDSITKALMPVVNKLGQGGQFVYQAYYRQQMVYAIEYSLLFSLGVLMMIFSMIGMFISIKKMGKETNEEDTWAGITLFIFGCLVAGFFIMAANFESSIGRFINPNYYVIQDLLNIVKNSGQ